MIFDRLDWIVIVGAVLLLALFTLGLLRLVYRRSRTPGQRLAAGGARRVILRTLTRGGDIHRWN